MTADRPTLIVHTVYFPITGDDPDTERPDDPERREAERLGLDLYDLLTRPRQDPLAWGPGIPVRVATRYDQVDLREADDVVLIPVLGPHSHRREDVRKRAVEVMRGWVKRLSERHVLPLPAGPVWRASEGQLPGKPMRADLYAPDDSRRRALDELVLRVARVLHGGDAPELQLFISFSKADLKATDNAAERIHEHVASDPTVKAYFDSPSLLAGEDVGSQIDTHSGKGVFLIVRGDRYSSSDRCQFDQLNAKRRQMPFLTLEFLADGEQRSLPYAGNGPTVVWDRDSQNPAAAVARQAMVEGVRHAFFERAAQSVLRTAGIPDADVIVLARPPELLDMAKLRKSHPDRLVILHPDPELSVHESAVLQEAHPRLRTMTPSTAYRGVLGRAIRGQLSNWQVALSLSETPDVGGCEGLTGHHVDDATAHLARSLISVGASIAYGGDFRDYGFDWLLVQLIEAYNLTAKEPADFLHSYLAASVNADEIDQGAFTAHSLGPFGALEDEALLKQPATTADRPSPARIALCVSDMRRVMARHTDARIVVAGAAMPKDPATGRDGYGGRYPGIVEEAWRSLEAGQPLYVVGGFGGAAGLVADVLERSEVPARLQEQTFESEAWFSELVADFDADPDRARLGLPENMAAMAAAIRELGRPHLESDEAARAWNGLNLAQNRELFRTRDPLVITSLVLQGLLTLEALRSHGQLHIELTHGSVADARELEVLVLPTFSDVPPSGAAAAVDRIAEGAASRAHERRGQPVKVRSGSLGADYLYAADLGPMWEALSDVPGHVRRACQETIAMAQRHGFSKIGVVTFLGNVADTLDEPVTAMVDGLRVAGDKTEILWFEHDAGRFDTLRELLEKAADVSLTTSVLASEEGDGPPRTIAKTILDVRQLDAALDVSVLVPRGNGIVPSHRSPVTPEQRRELVGGSMDPAPSESKLGRHGETLSQLLLGEQAPKVLEACRDSRFVIVHDAGASGLPYEALSAQAESGEIVTPALTGGFVRRLQVTGVGLDAGLTRPPRVGSLRVLLVVNPTGDLKGADDEAEAVRSQLKTSGVEIVELVHTQATVEAVVKSLQNPTIDILHYCGHAFFRGPGETESGLNCADGELTLADLRPLRTVPQVAFVNACQGGRMRAPATGVPTAQAFAEFFLRAGVNAYLGTFWLVSDDGAATFAASVYRELGGGAELGEAVVRGRQALKERGNSDWANYLLYGDSEFRMVRPSSGSGGQDST